MCWEMTGSCFIAPYVFSSACIIKLTPCTFLSSATLQQQQQQKKISCNSHFFLGYHGITGDRVWFWNEGKTHPSLPSLWGTADWVSTTQETKQAKSKQKKNLAVIEKYILQDWEKLSDIAVNVLRCFMFTLKKTKHCTLLDGSFPDGTCTPNPAPAVKLRDPVHFLQTAGRGCAVHDGHGTASWKTNRHMWICIIRTRPQLCAN